MQTSTPVILRQIWKPLDLFMICDWVKFLNAAIFPEYWMKFNWRVFSV